jgi:hypothetical protein
MHKKEKKSVRTTVPDYQCTAYANVGIFFSTQFFHIVLDVLVLSNGHKQIKIRARTVLQITTCTCAFLSHLATKDAHAHLL